MNTKPAKEVAERMAKLMAEKAVTLWQSGDESEAAVCASNALYFKLAAQQLEH